MYHAGMTTTTQQIHAIVAFRRTAQAPLVKAYLVQKLTEHRAAYTEAATQEQSAEWLAFARATAAIINTLFDEAV